MRYWFMLVLAFFSCRNFSREEQSIAKDTISVAKDSLEQIINARSRAENIDTTFVVYDSLLSFERDSLLVVVKIDSVIFTERSSKSRIAVEWAHCALRPQWSYPGIFIRKNGRVMALSSLRRGNLIYVSLVDEFGRGLLFALDFQKRIAAFDHDYRTCGYIYSKAKVNVVDVSSGQIVSVGNFIMHDIDTSDDVTYVTPIYYYEVRGEQFNLLRKDSVNEALYGGEETLAYLRKKKLL